MSVREILAAMEAEAIAEEARLAAEARARADAAVRAARREAEARRERRVARARDDARATAARCAAEATVRAAAARARARDALAVAIFDRAAVRLRDARDDPAYGPALEVLLREALASFGPDEQVVVRCDPRDAPAIELLTAPRRGVLRVDPSLPCWGGVLVHDAAERVVADDTLERRLERARERMRTDVMAVAG